MLRFRTWPVAAFGFATLLLLIIASMITTSRNAQAIFVKLDELNLHHQEVNERLQRLRSGVYLSGTFLRDYLFDIRGERATEYRQRLAAFRQSGKDAVDDLLVLDLAHTDRILSLDAQVAEYWQTFAPVLDRQLSEPVSQSASFLRNEVVPRRESILTIAQEIEQLNNDNLAAQRAEVSRQQIEFAQSLTRLLWQTVLLGTTLALLFVGRVRWLERRSEEQRLIALEAERRVRQLAQERDAAQEDERKRLSRELHDHVAQVLTALRMELSRLDRSRAPTDARIGATLSECKSLVDSLFRTVRDLALGLRPSMLDDLGLEAALQWHVRDFIRRYGIDVRLSIDGKLDALSDRHRTCVYRVVQEAMTNCARHAKAKNISVDVTIDQTQLMVSIADDGIGFDSSASGNGLGLRGIEERVKELQGSSSVVSVLGGGTTLRVQLSAGDRSPEVPLVACAVG
jgi:signal transduction histidine kinase